MLSPIPGEKDSVEGILSLGGDKKCKAKDAGAYFLEQEFRSNLKHTYAH
jgi:hypothetical protein